MSWLDCTRVGRTADNSLFLRFSAYTDGMLELEQAKVKTKAEADKILQKVEPVGCSLCPLGYELRRKLLTQVR